MSFLAKHASALVQELGLSEAVQPVVVRTVVGHEAWCAPVRVAEETSGWTFRSSLQTNRTTTVSAPRDWFVDLSPLGQKRLCAVATLSRLNECVVLLVKPVAIEPSEQSDFFVRAKVVDLNHSLVAGSMGLVVGVTSATVPTSLYWSLMEMSRPSICLLDALTRAGHRLSLLWARPSLLSMEDVVFLSPFMSLTFGSDAASEELEIPSSMYDGEVVGWRLVSQSIAPGDDFERVRVTGNWSEYLKSRTPSGIPAATWVPGLLSSCHAVAAHCVSYMHKHGDLSASREVVEDVLNKRAELNVASAPMPVSMSTRVVGVNEAVDYALDLRPSLTTNARVGLNLAYVGELVAASPAASQPQLVEHAQVLSTCVADVWQTPVSLDLFVRDTEMSLQAVASAELPPMHPSA